MYILIKIQNLARKITRNRKIFLNSKLSFTKNMLSQNSTTDSSSKEKK